MKRLDEVVIQEEGPARHSFAGSLLLAAFCLLTPALAQSPVQQPSDQQAGARQDVIRITVNLVQIDAVVTDSKGHQVTNLEPKDFEVSEDGHPQKITNFSYVTLQPAPASAPRSPATPAVPGAPAGPPARLRPEQVRRTIALVVDDLGLSFESTAFVRQALKKFVDTQVQPGDLVAILRTAAGMGALQQFTTDKRMLYAAIDRVRWYPFGRGGVSAFPALGNDSTEGAGSQLAAFRQEVFAVGTLGALNYVVRGLRELPGRKSVVLLSEGFQLFPRDDPGRYGRVVEELRRLTDLANRASVVMYALDARGLPTLGFTAADDVRSTSPSDFQYALSQRRSNYIDSQTGMIYLAEQTGGFFVHDNNDLSGGIRTILEDLSGYYLIGFKPDPTTFNAKQAGPNFHKMKVKVKVPGLHVRSRTGFYGVPDEEAHPVYQTRSEQLLAALTSPFGSGDVHLRLTSLFSNNPPTGSLVRSLLHIDARDLTYTDEPDGSKKTVLDILAVTFGENGAAVDQVDQTYGLRLKPDQYQQALARGFLYTLNVPIKKPGPYQLRVAIRDQSTLRVGSASQFIEVPDARKGHLALSGIVLNRDSAKDADPKANAVAESEGSPSVRIFRPGGEVFYGYQIYNAHVDSHTHAPQIEAQVQVFHDGHQVYASKPVLLDKDGQPDSQRLAAGGKLRLGTKMEPGDYVLEITVTDELAKKKTRTATQWIDFEIANSEKQTRPGGS